MITFLDRPMSAVQLAKNLVAAQGYAGIEFWNEYYEQYGGDYGQLTEQIDQINQQLQIQADRVMRFLHI